MEQQNFVATATTVIIAIITLITSVIISH